MAIGLVRMIVLGLEHPNSHGEEQGILTAQVEAKKKQILEI